MEPLNKILNAYYTNELFQLTLNSLNDNSMNCEELKSKLTNLTSPILKEIGEELKIWLTATISFPIFFIPGCIPIKAIALVCLAVGLKKYTISNPSTLVPLLKSNASTICKLQSDITSINFENSTFKSDIKKLILFRDCQKQGLTDEIIAHIGKFFFDPEIPTPRRFDTFNAF